MIFERRNVNKNKELYIETFKEQYIIERTWIATPPGGMKIFQFFKKLDNLLPIKLQKIFLDLDVGTQLNRYYDLEKVQEFLYHEGQAVLESKGGMEVISKKNQMNYKVGDVYAFKYDFEDFYRFFVIITDWGSEVCYVHVLKMVSKEPQIEIDKVGWEDVLTKLPIMISESEFKYDKSEKYYKLVKENIEINKEELNFLHYVTTDQETNEDICLDIYDTELKGENMLTALINSLFSEWIYQYIYRYEQYIKYIGEETLELFKYGNNIEDYIELYSEEVKEVPEEMMKLVYETDIPAPENKYKSVRVKKSGDEYSYFKQLDNYLLEVSEEISSATADNIDSEDMTGENFEVLIRFYLEENGFILEDIYSDSSSDIISFISKDEKKLREAVKEINKFLKNKKKVIKYVSENYKQIEWI